MPGSAAGPGSGITAIPTADTSSRLEAARKLTNSRSVDSDSAMKPNVNGCQEAGVALMHAFARSPVVTRNVPAGKGGVLVPLSPR